LPEIIAVLEALTDIDVGEWEGLSTGQIRSEYGKLYLDWQTGPDSFTFPGGESLSDVSARATSALGTIVSSHGHDCNRNVDVVGDAYHKPIS
jgi:broad specificity phosphatase PhoE